MQYQAIVFTSGRTGAGYLEIDDRDRMVPTRLTDGLGVTIGPGVYEYRISDVAPAPLPWMQLTEKSP